MIDMKLEESEKKDFSVPSEAPSYPYGLSISLDAEVLRKLGIHDKLPNIDDVLKLVAKVKVISVESTPDKGDDERHSIRLQITEMDLSGKGEKQDHDVIYGD